MSQLKELLTYLTNQFKFWFIVKEWENALHLRCGKVIRKLDAGFYFKLPLLDQVFSQHIRTRDIVVSQINFTTKDNKSICTSAATFYKIDNIERFYNGYAEPDSIVANIIKNELSQYFLSINFDDFSQQELEALVFSKLKEVKEKGFFFEDVKLISFSNAKTYRIIKDDFWGQTSNDLDKQLH